MRGNRFAVIMLYVLLDALILVALFYLSIQLATDFAPSYILIESLALPLSLLVIVILALNCILGVYNFKLEHMSIIEAIKVVFVSALCAVLVFVLRLVNVYTYPLSITIIFLVLYTFSSEIYRFSFRSLKVCRKLFGLYDRDNLPENVLIISNLDKAELILRRLLQGQQLKFKPVAVLTDDPCGEGKIFGLPIYPGNANLQAVLRLHAVKEVVLLAEYYTSRQTSDLKGVCDSLGVEIKVFESVHPIGSDNTRFFRQLNLEDLLGRDEINLQRTWIESFITGKRVLVTGAAGTIGSEICRQCIAFGCQELYALDFNENGLFELDHELRKLPGNTNVVLVLASIRDISRLNSVFASLEPEVCFHAAAHKHVPLMEQNPCEAIKNNIFGTLNVLKACDMHMVKKLIVISSDKAVNPSSVMGATKRVTEMLVQVYGKSMSTQIAAVRFGNVLGSNGSVVPLFRKQIENGGPVTLTHPDVERYFMTISEAVQLVLQTGALARQGEIFVFDMGKSVKIYDLAVALIKLAGLEPGVDIKIETIGLRPGEKLFEELRLDAENMDATRHKNIFVLKPMNIDRFWLDEQLEYLSNAVRDDDEEAVLERLFALVPSVYRKPRILPTKKRKENSSNMGERITIQQNG